MMRRMTRVRAEQVKVRELRQVGIESCAIMREGESEKQVLFWSIIKKRGSLFLFCRLQLALLSKKLFFCFLCSFKESIVSMFRHTMFANIMSLNPTERVRSSCLAFKTSYTSRLRSSVKFKRIGKALFHKLFMRRCFKSSSLKWLLGQPMAWFEWELSLYKSVGLVVMNNICKVSHFSKRKTIFVGDLTY